MAVIPVALAIAIIATQPHTAVTLTGTWTIKNPKVSTGMLWIILKPEGTFFKLDCQADPHTKVQIVMQGKISLVDGHYISKGDPDLATGDIRFEFKGEEVTLHSMPIANSPFSSTSLPIGPFIRTNRKAPEF